MSCALRTLFTTIIVLCEATNNICGLCDKHKDALCEDFRRDNSNTSAVEQMVLRDICDMGRLSNDMMRDVREEQDVSIDQEHLIIYESLNKEQREGFDEILQHVRANKSQVFFVDGPRGTGKTFLYKALLAKVWS